MKGINDDEEMIYDGTSFADGDEGDAQSVDSDVSQDENGDINGRETVTVAQLRQEIREKAKSVSVIFIDCVLPSMLAYDIAQLKETEVFDPMDINWYRDDDLADSRIDGDGLEIEVEVLRPGKPRGPLEDEVATQHECQMNHIEIFSSEFSGSVSRRLVSLDLEMRLRPRNRSSPVSREVARTIAVLSMVGGLLSLVITSKNEARSLWWSPTLTASER